MSYHIRRYSTKPRVSFRTHPSVSQPLRRHNNIFDTWPHSSIAERPEPTPKPVFTPISKPVGEAEIWRAENYKKIVELFDAKRTEGPLSPPEKSLAWWYRTAERCLRNGLFNVQQIDEIEKYAPFGRQVKVEKVRPHQQSLVKMFKDNAAEREAFDERQVEPLHQARGSPTERYRGTLETLGTRPEIDWKIPESPFKTSRPPLDFSKMPGLPLKTPEIDWKIPESPSKTSRTLGIPSKMPEIPYKPPKMPSATEVDDASGISRVESIIQYKFQDRSLCLEALTPKLDKHNVATTNNERLALLGGHALNTYVGDIWWESGLPTYFCRSWSNELESGSFLGYCGSSLGLDDFVLGLYDHEYKSPKRISAEAVQAIIGAVYLDSGRSINTLKSLMRALGVEKDLLSRVASAKFSMGVQQRFNTNGFESTRPPVKALQDDQPTVEPAVEPPELKPSTASPITRDASEEPEHQTAVSEPVPVESPQATRASIISALVPKLSHDELYYHHNWSNQKRVSVKFALEKTLKRWTHAMDEIRKLSCELKKNPPPSKVSAWNGLVESFKTKLRTYEKQFPTLFAHSAELGLLSLEQLLEEVEAQKSSTDSESATEDLVEEIKRNDEKELESAATEGSESQDTLFSPAGISSRLVDRPNVVPAPGSISNMTTANEHMLKDPQPAESEMALPELHFSDPQTPYTPQTELNRSDTIKPQVTVSGEADTLAKKANLDQTMQLDSDLKTGRGRELENFKDGSVTHLLESRDSTNVQNSKQTKAWKVEDEESNEILGDRVYVEDMASVFRVDLTAQSFTADDDARTGKPKAEGEFSWENYVGQGKDGL